MSLPAPGRERLAAHRARRRAESHGAAVLLAASLSLSPAAGQAHARSAAQGARSVPGRAGPIVELFVAGSDAKFGKLLTALDAPRFGAFDLRTERLEPFDDRLLFGHGSLEAGAHCFVDLSHWARVRLRCSDRAAERFVVHTVVLTPGGGAELGRAVGDALDALLDHDPSNLTREEAEGRLAAETREPPAPPDPEESAPPSPALVATAPGADAFPLRTGAFYGLSAHSSEIPATHRFGLLVGLVDFGSRRKGTFLFSGAYELPASYADPRFDMALSSLTLRTGAQSSAALGEGSTLGGRLLLGIDITRFAPRTGDHPPAYEPHPGTRTKSFVVSAAAVWSLRLGRERSFFAELTADIDPFAVRYGVRDARSGQVETLIERFRVRPGVSVGIRTW